MRHFFEEFQVAYGERMCLREGPEWDVRRLCFLSVSRGKLLWPLDPWAWAGMGTLRLGLMCQPMHSFGATQAEGVQTWNSQGCKAIQRPVESSGQAQGQSGCWAIGPGCLFDSQFPVSVPFFSASWTWSCNIVS